MKQRSKELIAKMEQRSKELITKNGAKKKKNNKEQYIESPIL